MMGMTVERRNEIAWRILVRKARKDGLSSFNTNNLKRDIGNRAKEIGITVEEGGEFARLLYEPLFKELMQAVKEDDGHNFRDGVEG